MHRTPSAADSPITSAAKTPAEKTPADAGLLGRRRFLAAGAVAAAGQRVQPRTSQ